MSCRAKSSSHSFSYRDNCEPDRQYFNSYRFNEEQHYDGEFFRDSFHGQGNYQWGDVAMYEGGFYSNFKEGYAIVSFPDNSNFEGLFIMNKPFGPGILTYSNGRQDAGFWMGKKLVRLSRAVDFIIPRLAPSSAAKIKLLQFRRLIPLDEYSWNLDLNCGVDILRKCGYPFEHFYSPYSSLIYDPRSIFFDSLAFENTYFRKCKELTAEFGGSSKEWDSFREKGNLEETQRDDEFKECPLPLPCLSEDDVENDICDYPVSEGEHELGILGMFTKFGIPEENEEEEGEAGEGEEEYKSRPSKIVSWNRSELCVEMLKQIFRYRAFEDKLNFDLAKLMVGSRTAFRKTGLREKQCLEFLKLCAVGPAEAVKNFLCNFEISEELMDGRGNNSLMFAASTDQHEVIKILLNYGVDVNTFNDENLTPLNLCLLRRLALANGIFSWELAFLPKEIEGAEENIEAQPWQFQESIASLDRIFGDGLSMNNSQPAILKSTSFTTPTNFEKDTLHTHTPMSHFSLSNNYSKYSQIAIQKSPGGRSLTQANHKSEGRFPAGLKTSFSAYDVRTKKPDSTTAWLTCRKAEPRFTKTDEFQRSIKKSSRDKYLFDFSFARNLTLRLGTGLENSEKLSTIEKQSKQEEPLEEKNEEEDYFWRMGEDYDTVLENKFREIDKTIEILLQRGANPNISEVPKPSLHLAIYSRDVNVVNTLLFYGANPNTQLYFNEGSLTPLHVIMLQNPSPEYVAICKMLLDFDADPNVETSPEFTITQEEKDFLDPVRGRNPLQLLCMRPDLEIADPGGYLTQVALILAEKINRSCMYNGFSYLSLAMLNGNVKLLKALLESKLFDVNEILEKDRGTALHVLVSTEFQKRNNYPVSIDTCDRLLEGGANPLMTFKEPKSLIGNCVDYGNREIAGARESRKSSEGAASKKSDKSARDKSVKEKGGKEKGGKDKNGKEKPQDYLQDHIKVVEYLDKKATEIYEKEKGKRTDSNASQKETVGKSEKDKKGKDDKKTGGKGGDGKDKKKDAGDGKDKNKEADVGKDKNKEPGDGKDKNKEPGDGKDKNKEPGDRKDKNKEPGDGKDKNKEPGDGKDKNKEPGDGKDKKKGIDDGKKKGLDDGKDKIWDSDEGKDKRKRTDGEIDGKKGKDKDKDKGKDKKDLHDKSKKDKMSGIDKKKVILDEKSLKDKSEDSKKKASRDKKLRHGVSKTCHSKLATCSETFPERIRQSILRVYGHCAMFDINELLVPYVVLRDGELYYKFKGNTKSQEQYSLI